MRGAAARQLERSVAEKHSLAGHGAKKPLADRGFPYIIAGSAWECPNLIGSTLRGASALPMDPVIVKDHWSLRLRVSSAMTGGRADA